MSRYEAPEFRRCIDNENCWECDHADCLNRKCLKYDFEFVGNEYMVFHKCKSFKEI